MWNFVRTWSLGFLFIILLVFFVLRGPALIRELRLSFAPYTDGIYAFYLSSGHTFYGSVASVNGRTIALRNAYSFQSTTVGDVPTSNLQAQILNPLTMPENWIAISRDSVLFYEKLTEEAQLMPLIEGRR